WFLCFSKFQSEVMSQVKSSFRPRQLARRRIIEFSCQAGPINYWYVEQALKSAGNGLTRLKNRKRTEPDRYRSCTYCKENCSETGSDQGAYIGQEQAPGGLFVLIFPGFQTDNFA